MLFVGVCLTNLLYAQNKSESFDDFRKNLHKGFNADREKKLNDFNEFRRQINAEYAAFIRNAWRKEDSKPAEEVPARPEPPKPVVRDPQVLPTSDPIPVDVVISSKKSDPPGSVKPEFRKPADIPKQVPETEMPDDNKMQNPFLVNPTALVDPAVDFDYYGTNCYISYEDAKQFKLSRIDENSIADAWLELSDDKYLPLINECMAWRQKLNMSDWGYYLFLKKMTAEFFSYETSNEGTLMQMYILTQSGYKVRMARAVGKYSKTSHLVLLIPSENCIYRYSYLLVDDVKYYVIDTATEEPQQYYLLDREFPKEQYLSLAIPKGGKFEMQAGRNRTLVSKRYPNMRATVTTNKNLIDFYNDYPVSGDWNIYARTSLSESLKQQLYPAIKRNIAGKSKTEAANIILNFVQTAFEYATDQEQFGRERPLFADESVYYPYCDCEDRSIMYASIVRDLLGLDVVLLEYPEHLATAVCFGNESVDGDYLTINGRKYVVCDPTYIGASIGDAMSKFKRSKVKVISID